MVSSGIGTFLAVLPCGLNAGSANLKYMDPAVKPRSDYNPIIIAGPTASGKSAYAIKLALEVGGEIICGDSRQLFAHMRIGTAGPSDEDLKIVPHHGYRIIEPTETMSAGDFIALTDNFVAEVQQRKKIPIIVGGSGLYLRSYRFGLDDVPKVDEQVKEKIQQRLHQEGVQKLYEQLAEIDPNSAHMIKSTDEVRILRALEIYFSSRKLPSELRVGYTNRAPRITALWLLVWPEKEQLIKRIALRVRAMFSEGLVKEACVLRNILPKEHHLLTTMGYEEALRLADGNMSEEQAIEETTRRHKAYAKRQMTWFKKEEWWKRIPLIP